MTAREEMLARHGLPGETGLWLRFGPVPEGGRSAIHASPNAIKHLYRRSDLEHGVSVFDLEFCDDGLLGIHGHGNATTAIELVIAFERGRRKGYVVVGRQVTWDDLTEDERERTDGHASGLVFGIDGEPVLRDVRVLEEVAPYTVRIFGMHEPDPADAALWDEVEARDRAPGA